MVFYLCRMCQCGLHEVLLSQICIYLCTSSLLNLAVPQGLYSTLSVPVERSCWQCIRWCGTGGFQEHGQCFFIGISFLIPFRLVFSVSLLSVCGMVLWGCVVFSLIGCKSLTASLALQISFINLYYKKSRVSPPVRHTHQLLDKKNQSKNVNQTDKNIIELGVYTKYKVKMLHSFYLYLQYWPLKRGYKLL